MLSARVAQIGIVERGSLFLEVVVVSRLLRLTALVALRPVGALPAGWVKVERSTQGFQNASLTLCFPHGDAAPFQTVRFRLLASYLPTRPPLAVPKVG